MAFSGYGRDEDVQRGREAGFEPTPQWTFAHQVGNVTGVTIAVRNPANTQFGVRAINSDGDRSPVSYAGPATS